MSDPAVPRRPCTHAPRCRRQVFDAQLVKQRGAPVALVLDGEPWAWIDGARYKIKPTGVATVTVQKLTATQIHQAFGNVLLYVEHAEVCEAEQRKKKAKKVDGHA